MNYKKVLKGLFIAVAGAALTFATEQIPNIDFKEYTPFVVAGFSAAINAAREYLKTL